MDVQVEMLQPEQITALSNLIVRKPSDSVLGQAGYFKDRQAYHFSEINMPIQSVFANNQPKQEIAKVFALDIMGQQFDYVSSKAGSQRPNHLDYDEYFTAGLFKKKGGEYSRVNLTKEMLMQMAKGERELFYKIYASKCGDFARALFDSEPPNENIANNFIKEAKTLALLQLFNEGNEEVRKAILAGKIGVDEYLEHAVCDDFTSVSAIELVWKSKTIELIKHNLSLINAVAAISQADKSIAGNVFGVGAVNVDTSFKLALQELDQKFALRAFEGFIVYGKQSDEEILQRNERFSKIYELFVKKT